MGNIIYVLITALYVMSFQVSNTSQPKKDIPDVFQLTDSDVFATELQSEYSMSLLHACRFDSNLAFQYWRPFTKEIERRAHEDGLSTPGTKLWIKAFWDQNGRLTHIGYAPQREDADLDHDQWENLFRKLIREYDMSGDWPSGFYHLGSISLP